MKEEKRNEQKITNWTKRNKKVYIASGEVICIRFLMVWLGYGLLLFRFTDHVDC